MKNSIILQYHMLHCTPTPGQKSEKKTTSSSSSSSTLAGAAVEKKIIDSKRSTASPVDMILKKLTEKVQSSPSPSSAILSPVSSPGSNYKFFKSKDEKSADPAKKSVDDAANMKDHIKSCHDKQISVKMKNISQTEIQKSPTTGKSKSQKSPMKSLDSKAAPVSSPKKPEKKESSKAPSLKSPPLKSNAKSPKSKEQVVKPSASTKKSPAGRPPAKKKRLSALSSDSETDGKAKKKRKSYTEDSDSDDDSEFEVKKKRKPTLYCFESCFEEESNEMIG